MKTYKCECCFEVFKKDKPEDQCIAEAKMYFPQENIEDMPTVCHNCFVDIMRHNNHPLENDIHIVVDTRDVFIMTDQHWHYIGKMTDPESVIHDKPPCSDKCLKKYEFNRIRKN